MTIHDDIAGVVLAGGRSRRFGSNKALALFRGRRIIDHAVASLLDHVGELFIATDDAAPFFDIRLAQVVEDIVPGQGPIGGIVTAFSHTTCDRLFVLACDTFADGEAVARILEQRVAPAAIAAVEGEPHYLCGLYSRELEPRFQECLRGGRRSMREALAAVEGIALVEMARGEIANINTPDDLMRLEGMRLEGEGAAHAL